MEPRPIHDDDDLQVAKAEMRRLWDAQNAADVRRLTDWGMLVDLYEASLVESPREVDPVAVILAEMDMNGRTRGDLAAIIGENRASEIINRKRPLTLRMIRRLHRVWNIPAEMLIAEYETVAA